MDLNVWLFYLSCSHLLAAIDHNRLFFRFISLDQEVREIEKDHPDGDQFYRNFHPCDPHNKKHCD